MPDTAAFEALAAATPNDLESFVTKAIGLYLEHAAGLVEKIRSAPDSGDCEAARSALQSVLAEKTKGAAWPAGHVRFPRTGLDVDSRPGEGTWATIAFPAAGQPASAHHCK